MLTGADGLEVALTAVVAFIADAVVEDAGVVEDEVGVVEEVHHGELVGDGGEAGGLRAGAVEVLVLGVEGDAEGRAGAPLEGVLGAAGELDGGGAAAGDDVDVLVVEVLLDVELTAGFDLGDVGAEVVALAREVDVCAAAAEAGPGFDLAVDAVHAVLFQDGHALAADELGVWVALVVGSDEVRVCLPVVVRLWCRGHLASSLRVVVPGVGRCVKPGYVWAFSAASAAWWKSSSTSWMMGLKPWAVYCAAPVRRRLP